jgi:hypothetical protein
MTVRKKLCVLLSGFILSLICNSISPVFAEEIGTWAVVDANGNVINSIVCTDSFCGTAGETRGNVPGCEGCRYVEQKPNSLGFMPGFTQPDRTVTYDAVSGEFKTEFRDLQPAAPYAPPTMEPNVNSISTLATQAINQDPQLKTTVPYEEQIGSWAVVDLNGNVINAIVCQEKVCGPNGEFKGKLPDGYAGGCIGGCSLVLQIAPNPITGQSMGGLTTSPGTKVTYSDGIFTVERTIVTNEKNTIVIDTIQNGIETNFFGQKRDLTTSEILYVPLEKAFADAINSGNVLISKSKSSYVFDVNFDTSKTDRTVKISASKSGYKTKVITLKLNSQGDLVLPSTTSLKGYKLTISQGNEILGKFTLKK